MWSVSEAAGLLGISGQRVRKLLLEGRIKGKRLSGAWVVLELSYTRKKRLSRKGALYVGGDNLFRRAER